MKLKRKGKVALLSVLVVSLITANLVGMAVAKSNNDAKKNDKQMTVSASVPDVSIEMPDINEVSVIEAVYDTGKARVDSVRKKSDENREKRMHKRDRYNYSKQDIEELLLAGATVEDIYLSDQIANEWLVDPKGLIERKKSGEAWEGIEQNVRSEKEGKLKVLLKKHKNVEKKLNKKKMNIAEKVELLEAIDALGEEVADQVIAAYETGGVQAITGQSFSPAAKHTVTEASNEEVKDPEITPDKNADSKSQNESVLEPQGELEQPTDSMQPSQNDSSIVQEGSK